MVTHAADCRTAAAQSSDPWLLQQRRRYGDAHAAALAAADAFVDAQRAELDASWGQYAQRNGSGTRDAMRQYAEYEAMIQSHAEQLYHTELAKLTGGESVSTSGAAFAAERRRAAATASDQKGSGRPHTVAAPLGGSRLGRAGDDGSATSRYHANVGSTTFDQGGCVSLDRVSMILFPKLCHESFELIVEAFVRLSLTLLLGIMPYF